MTVLLDTALGHSLALTTGTGSPTLTRATAMWVFDNEDKLVDVPASAAAFGGARMVWNIVKGSSEDFTVSDWQKSRTTFSAGKLLDTVDNATHRMFQSGSNLSGSVDTLTCVFEVKAAEYTKCVLAIANSNESSPTRVVYDLTLGTVGSTLTGTPLYTHIEPLDDGYYHCELRAATTAANYGFFLFLYDDVSGLTFIGDGTKGVYVRKAYCNVVTGQSDQTAGEYVSVGVESAPYHGAGLDGVKWFNTNKDGTPIPASSLLGLATNEAAVTNTMLSCRRFAASDVASTCPWRSSVAGWVEKVTNGGFDTNVSGFTAGSGVGATIAWNPLGYMDCYTGTGSNELVGPIVVTGLVIGETYTVSYDRISSSGGSVGIYVITAGILMQSGFSSTAASRSLTFNATATTHTVSIVASGSGVNATIDNISFRKADVQVQNNQTGLDNAANSCSLLTATAANATILQTITAAAAAGCTGFYVKRSVGTGTISITRDGGTSWTDITSLINSSTFTKVKIENTSVTNPSVGFKFGTSGDAIIVDGGINHLGTKLHYLPILTTSAAITVDAQTLTYPTAGNISDTAGTILATVTIDDWASGHDGLIGSTTSGLGTLATNSGVKATDGTNTANGPTGTPTGTEQLGIRWSGSVLEALNGSVSGPAGVYDGSFGLASIGVLGTGYVRDVKIYDTALSDADIGVALGSLGSRRAMVGVGV